MRIFLALFIVLALGKTQWFLLEKDRPPLLSPGPDATPRATTAAVALWCETSDDVIYLLDNQDTWRYELSNKRWLWQPPSPAVRNRTNAAYWTVGASLYLYGGMDGSTILNDMWVYDSIARTYTQIQSGTGLPCYGSSFWKHETTNRLYMWGGCNGSTGLRAFDLNSQQWTENIPDHDDGNGKPTPARFMAAALGANDLVYLYTDDKLWTLDMLQFKWNQAPTDNGSSPPGPQRTHHIMWMGQDQSIMLYGGKSGSKEYTDTWSYKKDQWKIEDIGNGPSPRIGATTCVDKSGDLVLFGGGDTNDLYKYGDITVQTVFELIEWKLDSATLTASVAAVFSALVFFGLVVLALYVCVRHCVKKRKKRDAMNILRRDDL